MKIRVYYFFGLMFFILIIMIRPGKLTAQPHTDDLLKEMLGTNTAPAFQQVLQNPQVYKLQIIYTKIDRDKNNRPHFQSYYFNYDSTLYFNPASTVKLAAAALSLEKLNRINRKGINRDTGMEFDSAFSKQTRLVMDNTSPSGKPNIAHFIRRALIVGENTPYNRMYEFVGQQQFNRRLHAMGYLNTRITHRFIRLNEEENRHTNPVRFYDEKGRLIYTQPAAYNPDRFEPGPNEWFGKGYMDNNDSLITGPFDFTNRNRISLGALDNIVRSIIFPDAVPEHQRFDLRKSDYQLLRKYMSQYAGENNFPKYDGEKYYPGFAKFFFRDSAHKSIPENIRVFNKTGWAYGFLTDNSYIVDFENKVEFMLSATIYVNSDGILNDGAYDYETIGHPFLYQLGQTVYTYELRRKREAVPDLKVFEIKYDRRVVDDRPVISSVDN